jgi:transglutaminase-like putative cysteine protease
MADAPHDAARGERLAALGAVALLAAATALAFGRVFAGPEPTARLVAAAVASVGVAGLTERRPPLVAALASAAGLAIAVAALVFPRTAFLWVLPTEATLDAVGRAVRVVGEQARVQVAPTPPLPALVLAAVTAVWTAAFSIHALAIRAGGPILAALPPVGLLGFADSVLLDGARPGYAALFLGALLAVTFLDGLRRVRRWGPIVARPGRRWLTGTTTTGARRVAAAALGVAILTPGILPGFRSGPLLDITTIAEDETVGIDPFVSIRDSLRRDEPVELFRIRADRPAYWRMLGLERFDGESWRTGDLDLSEALPYGPGDPLEGRLSGVGLLRQEVEVVRDLAFPWVPVAFPAYTIDLGSAFRYDPNLGTAAGPENLAAGMRYVATSQPQAPTPEQLARVHFQPPFRYGVYTELPADTPEAIYDIARRWTEDRPTAFEKILAIQDRLRTFRYDETVPARADSFTLVDFLTRTRRGFCQQFASAMAVLVRALGYPARVAVGFTPGTPDEATGTYAVTTDEAHSWVEVLFPGYGWLAFEPTPRRENPLAEPYLSPPATGCPPGSPGCPTGAETEAREAGAGLDGNLSRQLTAHDRELAGQGARRRGAGGGIEPPPGGVPLRPIGAGLAALALLALVLVPPVRAARRRLHVARSREPRALVLACYDVFSSRAADLGLGRREGETVQEHRRRLAEAAAADGDLETLARLVHAAAYGPAPVGPEEAREARRATRGAVRDLVGRTGLARRIAGAYRPGW